jgi:hypothetical protein
MTTDILDSPVPTHFKHGWFFPFRIRLLGFSLLAICIPSLLFGSIYIGIGTLILGIFISFSFSGVKIDTDKQEVSEYTNYFGFIKTAKKYSYLKLHYITAMPKRESTTVNANIVQHTVDTTYKFTITLFTESFRSKKEITVYDSKSEAVHVSKQLAYLLKLNYFEYDPQFVRDRLTQR